MLLNVQLVPGTMLLFGSAMLNNTRPSSQEACSLLEKEVTNI